MPTDHDQGTRVFLCTHYAMGWYSTAIINAVTSVLIRLENLTSNARIPAIISRVTMILVDVLHFGEAESKCLAIDMIQWHIIHPQLNQAGNQSRTCAGA